MHSLIHHLHRKKASKQQTAPDLNFSTTLLYKITIIAGIISPLMVLPQIYEIYSTRDASGVSALSWFAFGLLDIPFVIYGFVHKEKPIVITYTLFLAGNLIVAVGALIYG